MLNRPTSTLSDDTGVSASWHGDADPQSRLIVLWIVLLLPILVVFCRVAQLQLTLQDEFAAGFSATSETSEDIPARDGRILASDGSLLATDIQRYDIAIFYPAIQDPPDEAWIASKAKLRLAKKDRKDKSRQAAEKQRVIGENDAMWSRLATLTDRPLEEILASRRHEQERVVRIKDSVQRAFRERQSGRAAAEEPADSTSGWNAFWQRLRQQMAEPVTTSNGPRLITEELEYHTVIRDVSVEIKEEIEAHPQRYPYAKVLVLTRRTYPRGELASHLIGTRKPLTEEQFRERREQFPDGDPLDYRLGDSYGTAGLEKAYDSHIKGVRGKRTYVKNRRGEIVETRIEREPQHGKDLVLTLDADLQIRSEELLDAALKVTQGGTVDLESMRGATREVTCPQGGCLVALDVHTGAVIAAAAAPRFDLNLLVAPDSTRWEEAISDPRSPFLSRVTQMALPPGSVFKVVSAVAAIESGKMRPDEQFHCQGYLDRPTEYRCLPFRHQGVGHGGVTLEEALCRSCNVYFYTAGRRMGPQTLVNWARQFGIGQPTGIDLPYESSGHLPSPDAPLKPGEHRQPWRPGDTLGMAIGQAQLTVTPLQMARVMAAIANDGNLVTPHLAAHSGPTAMGESDSIRNSRIAAGAHPITNLHEGTLDHVRTGMTMVVHDSHGTAHKTVCMKEVTIAGKTGTAQANGVDHAWFVGYVPAERPRVAFAVVLEHGGSGGKAAGPVAREFVKALLERGVVAKTADLASSASRQSRKGR